MIRIQEQDFNHQIEYEQLRKSASVGAIVTFSGLVRDINQGQSITSLTLEHYPEMAEKSLTNIVERARVRWDIIDCSIVHRVGQLQLSEQIVFVGVACLHRHEAFSACEFIIDHLKTETPFWKKECTSENKSYWLDANDTDFQAVKKWQK